ncbi:MAG: chemotaxis protein CheD [Bacteroidales bacterium]|nr:chemotaxis protein CheD [Bacteroidales bacterium]
MENDKKTFFLYPGQLVVFKEPMNIMTILGSCVAVCIWDVKLRFGGMNHYLLPLWKVQGLRTPKYGNVAIETLIEEMLKNGSSAKNLVAKVFGGAKVLETGEGNIFEIGRKNYEIAQEVLSKYNIRTAVENVGGLRGRKILFKTNTGEVLMKYIDKTISNNN